MGFDQRLADMLDEAMLERPLPPTAAAQLGSWLDAPQRGRPYRNGTGPHSVTYSPHRWTSVTPWPDALADRSTTTSARVSREQVVEVFRHTRPGGWTGAFTASQVWGHGRTGYGPHRTAAILAPEAIPVDAERILAEAVHRLNTVGPSSAYTTLLVLKGLGPAFLTKFLYFAAKARPETAGLAPLILDSQLARVLRAHAIDTGEEAGYTWAEPIAARIWRDAGWTSHRYDIYLRWMHTTTAHLTATVPGWPPEPDLLELALFDGAWKPGT
ncbi:hypothetical protein [Streptomyces sp. SID8352]|uniref:8-oxoguanine DNA glycosylase OGG fold protein n=1 Tax=Streptomyces sp. SID8352 TaxID=2690338 RepID=UPI001368A6B5|nr:hypothetical protein [Streptomyces sp. SID8352]MYU25642.1 hypothetical protein [Streptomyces sp. SID8352]